MPFIALVVTLLVVGFALANFNLDPQIKGLTIKVVTFVTVVVLLLWLLSAFGVWGSFDPFWIRRP